MGRRAEAQPLVSVLLPVYNAGATLPEALETLIAQTYPRWEVCLVDDGSTDGSPSIAEAFALRDGRIRISRGPHRGIVEALNGAAGMARGELFMRMDADDRCHPERAERLVRFLAERPDVGLAGSLVRLFPREAVGPGMCYYERWLNGLRDHGAIVRDLYVECPLAHPSMVIRRELFERLGGYEDHRWPEDYDLVLRAHRAGTRFGKVERVLLDWRESPGRLSKTGGAYAPDRFLACKVHYLAAEHFADRSREAVIWGAGPDGKRLARALIGEGIALRAFIEVDPRKIGQTIHGAPVWSEGDIERARGALNLAAVGQKGARKIIRWALDGAGFVEGRSYVCTR